MTLNKLLLIAAVICLAIAFVITAGWVNAEGDARDAWLIGGIGLGFGSFLP